MGGRLPLGDEYDGEGGFLSALGVRCRAGSVEAIEGRHREQQQHVRKKQADDWRHSHRHRRPNLVPSTLSTRGQHKANLRACDPGA